MVSETLQYIEQKMSVSVGILKSELVSIRTSRATPALIEHIKAEYGGVPLPLNQIATISAPEARLLIVQPWDRGSIHSIDRSGRDPRPLPSALRPIRRYLVLARTLPPRQDLATKQPANPVRHTAIQDAASQASEISAVKLHHDVVGEQYAG